MILLDGNKIAKEIRDELSQQVKIIEQKLERKPSLVVILIGNNGASLSYVNSKIKDCENIGYTSQTLKFSDTISEIELLIEINKLNLDPLVDGFIVQLPLPKHISERNIINAISPAKDVDGFHPENIGKLALNQTTFVPATPAGIIELLDRYNIETGGKHCVIIGRSNIVGMPMSLLMFRDHYPGNSTVTVAHSKTRNLENIVKQADILIVAIGKPSFIIGNMVKEGVVVIDVGISRVEDVTRKKGYRIVGDVDFDSVSKKASFITPVPGGVGPMTRAILLKNTMLAYKISGTNKSINLS